MNKYTLTFNDSKLEGLYQANQLKTLIFPIFLLMNIGGSIYISSILVWQIILSRSNSLGVNIAFLAWSVISLVVITKKKHWAQYQVLLLNYIYMTFQLTIKADSDPQQAYILAASSMMAQCINLFICDFKLAALNNFSLFIFRIAIASTIYETYFFQYILIIIVSTIIMFSLYRQNYNTRAYYLSTLKDNQWESILPQVVRSEFYLFRFNRELLKFEVLRCNQSHKKDGHKRFYELIRGFRMKGGETLELFIYNRTTSQQLNIPMLQQTQNLEVELCGKTQYISYSEFYLSELNFMIVLESPKVNQLMHEHAENIKNQLMTFNHFIKQTASKLQKYVVQKDLSKVQTLQLIFFEFQARLKLQTSALRTECINLQLLVLKCSKYFNNIIITHNFENSVQIQTIKPLFVLMLIRILKVTKSRRVDITVCNYSRPELRIHGKFDNYALQKDLLFQRALKIIVETFEQTQNYYCFRFQQDFCFSGLHEVEFQLRNL